MATSTDNDPYEIYMNSESEGDSSMQMDEVNSSDLDSGQSDDDSMPPEPLGARKWIKTD